MHYIFRKSDGEILYAPDTSEQLENETAACLTNEGGSLDDYVIVEGPVMLKGQHPTLVGGVVVPIEHPAVTARKEVKARVRGKLAALGLADDEITSMVG